MYYQPYTVYCTCTESICSHYMYLGLQCVGVSCSNHFLSPAGNAGYSVLVSCSEKIVQSLSEDPKALALHLLSAGLITVSNLEKPNEYVNETKREGHQTVHCPAGCGQTPPPQVPRVCLHSQTQPMAHYTLTWSHN